jgi:hypothetical protein
VKRDKKAEKLGSVREVYDQLQAKIQVLIVLFQIWETVHV